MQKLTCCTIVLLMLISCTESPQQKNDNDSTAVVADKIHCAPQTTDKSWYSSGKKAPLLKGLDGVDFKITTTSNEAQRYFNQGLMLSYGFNHAEAARSFYEATKLDPNCAACFWGYAYVLGPNYNAGMEEDNFERAYVAAQKAMELAVNASKKELELIHALTFRYAAKPTKDRSSLDIAFSGAMEKVYKQFPGDPDISALYAESVMDLHPWDLYDGKTKAPKPWTPEILAVLEKLMKLYPKHPGAPHFYVHAVEASTHSEKGLAAAKLLETLVPGAGHLVHMPSHIYIRTGHYHLGSLSNIEAIKVDSNYVEACHAQGAYPLTLYPHNMHFLAATAALEGNSKLAWEASVKMQALTPKEIMDKDGWGTLQHYYSIPYYIAVTFGMWDEILKTPAEKLTYPRAVLHYARGMAYLGKNDLQNAGAELDSLSKLSQDTILKAITIWGINSTSELVQIAHKVLSAELLSRQRQPEKALTLLREAIALEDNLRYNEPPDWFFSVRHYLGKMLLDNKKYAEAEKVYNQDLVNLRENGFALIGLYQALQMQGKISQANIVKQRFDKAWQYADKKIDASSVL